MKYPVGLKFWAFTILCGLVPILSRVWGTCAFQNMMSPLYEAEIAALVLSGGVVSAFEIASAINRTISTLMNSDYFDYWTVFSSSVFGAVWLQHWGGIHLTTKVCQQTKKLKSRIVDDWSDWSSQTQPERDNRIARTLSILVDNFENGMPGHISRKHDEHPRWHRHDNLVGCETDEERLLVENFVRSSFWGRLALLEALSHDADEDRVRKSFKNIHPRQGVSPEDWTKICRHKANKLSDIIKVFELGVLQFRKPAIFYSIILVGIAVVVRMPACEPYVTSAGLFSELVERLLP